MRRRWSMSGPNAFSMRRAIPGVSAALPCRRSERVARRTFKISAAQILGDTSRTWRLWPGSIFGNARQNHWRTVGKLGDQRKIPAHGLDRFSERGQQEIAPPFEARNTVLGDPERLGHLYLRELARVPQFAQGHFLSNQLCGAGLDLLALGGAQFLHFVLQRDWHSYVPFFFVRDRRSSNLSSAFAMSWR